MTPQTLGYQSSVDGTKPLLVDVCFKPSRKKLPLIVVMHGYSGGGGNTFACFVRFPDLFRVAASFFGVPDYAAWHKSKGRPDCNKVMVETLGGPPSRLPAVYAARDATRAARNNGQTRFHIFWDIAESQCPGKMNEDFLRAAHRNCIAHRSRKTDRVRWHHGYTTNWPELIKAEDIFVPEILERRLPEPTLPPAGRLVVPGYVVTRHFQIWVQPAGKPAASRSALSERDPPRRPASERLCLLAGQSGVAEVQYRLDGERAEFTVLSVSKGHQVRIVRQSRS